MSTSEAASNWDFGPVISLLHSFRSDGNVDSSEAAAEAERPRLEPAATLATDRKSNDADDNCKLGDFTAVWDYLAQAPLPRRDENGAEAEIHLEVHGNNISRDAVLGGIGELPAPPKTKILLQRRPRHTEEPKPVDEKPVVPVPKVLLTRPKPDRDDGSLKQSQSLARSPPKRSHAPDLSSLATPPRSKNTNKLSSPGRYQIESRLTGTAEEKRRDLIFQLCERCPNERKLLSNPKLCDPAFILTNTSESGIHVFVDASNISVGFHDCIKMMRNVPATARVPRLPLSFHNLSLVLERGRPVSKRVLVGSDRFPAIDEAEQLGYETNILERVQKVKDTPRKKKFGNGDGSNGASKGQDQSSGSETNGGPQLQRWVEQAVDEILHLKMLESLIDTAEPSTIVLATGDAAEAEYSDGFLRMVERALEKGWRVELVSFSCTTSRAYRRKDFRAKWSSRFVMIQLDTYAEHLLAM